DAALAVTAQLAADRTPLVGLADLPRDGLADGPPEVLRPVQGALEPGTAHLQRVRSAAVEIVERGLDALRRRRDGVEVDAAVAVDDDADRAGAARARELA